MNFDDFDPNKPIDDGETPVYGVYKGGRTMKTFVARGHALSSFMHGRTAKLYQMVNGRWVEIAYRDSYLHKGPCDCCGNATARTIRTSYGRQYKTDTGRWVWDKQGGKIVEPLNLLWACGECRYARGL